MRRDPRAFLFSTSTRNFPNRLGKGANVYLSSAELGVAAMLGRLPTVQEYLEKASGVNKKASEIYRYLNFHLMEKYREQGAGKVIPIATV